MQSPSRQLSSQPPMISDLLEQQKELTAVQRFSAFHESESVVRHSHHYQDLIPLSAPTAGEQYAFEVDLDLCSGCKACVSACHHLNGLQPAETWRQVGMLLGTHETLPILQHVTTACHHCLEPACLVGCPTEAYQKDPTTGVVRHLDDQCFGCQYCTMACPYEVPQYLEVRGIVRKCDMCHQRLAVGEAPACVQACPNQAIRITNVTKDDVERNVHKTSLLPGAPSSAITKPTTIFRSQRVNHADWRPADNGVLRPQHAHPALVLMLVLTQFSVGMATPALWGNVNGTSCLLTLCLSLAMAILGIAAATCHLGRPLYAFRGMLGWRHSWLSREAIAFAMFLPTTGLLACRSLFGIDISASYNEIATVANISLRHATLSSSTMQLLESAVPFVCGWIGVYCSARIYQFTQRALWRGHRTLLRFGLTSVLGVAAGALLDSVVQNGSTTVPVVGMATLLVVKLCYEAMQLLAVLTPDSPIYGSAQLMLHHLRYLTILRYGLGLTAIALLLLVAIRGLSEFGLWAVPILALISGLIFAGELVERTLYFKAVEPLRMPGGISA
ncbi:MAG: dimethyl sulfoxide reductase anchor subunit [Planctomycetales bacterium]|nr:dimethyl sulfoxide reductase anchor subunit [Planctomycetales bacterium]